MSLSPQQLGKPLKVLRRIQETKDAVSLVLDIPASLQSQFKYQAGQFVTFFLTVSGESLNRSYSLSSSPLVDSEFKITVKKVEGGRGSNFLCNEIRVGDTLLTSPPAGNFFKPLHSANGSHYFLIAAGSGITPVFSIMKTVLSESEKNQVTLIYCNRDRDAIIYLDQLEEWQKKYSAQLRVHHVLSGESGRLTTEGLKNLVSRAPHWTNPSRAFYLCGPTEFMKTAEMGLQTMGVTAGEIRKEDFGGAISKPKVELDSGWTLIGEKSEAQSPEKIIAEIQGEIIEVAAKAELNILETLLEAGAQPPYSCLDGDCMACLAKIQEGLVYQTDPCILTDQNIAAGETLTCQAKPLSRIVKLTFDNL